MEALYTASTTFVYISSIQDTINILYNYTCIDFAAYDTIKKIGRLFVCNIYNLNSAEFGKLATLRTNIYPSSMFLRIQQDLLLKANMTIP